MREPPITYVTHRFTFVVPERSVLSVSIPQADGWEEPRHRSFVEWAREYLRSRGVTFTPESSDA